MKLNARAITLLVAYIGSIVVANWAVHRFGVVPIGFGLYAPAAVYVVGVTLVLRDLLQDATSGRTTIAAIIVGAGLSAAISPSLALASGVAFLLSELLDLAVYSRIRRAGQGRIAGVVASNAVSITVDSLIFLTLAFGSLQFFPGQWVGKALATAIAVLIIAAVQVADRRQVSAA